MESVDLMQRLRAAAFTALTKVMSDMSVDPETRVQAAIAALTFSSRELEDAWVYSDPTNEVPPLAPVPEIPEDGA